MENAPLISVIIPMYNAEKYLGECFDSLLAQTFKNFEIVLIDDCSTDKSRKIAESYIEKFDGRLKIYDSEKNSGAGAARNKGLMLSQGEYVFFMDADDTIAPNALEEMYSLAKKSDVDVVNCTKGYKMNAEGTEVTPINLNDPNSEFLVEEDMSWRIQNLLKNNFGWNVWIKLSRRDFLIDNKIFFPEDIEYAEDQVWTHGILFCAKKILHLPRPYYSYRQSENSIVRKKRNALQIVNVRLRVIINGLKWIDDMMEKNKFFQLNPQLRHKVLDHFTRRFYNGLLKHTGKTTQTDIYDSLKKEFGKDFGEYDVLIPALCTLVNTNQKKIEELKKKLKNK
ncbi:MAG: glycosyltransferase [Selenomonadaceae bacterium]|nr:glycosyltransferase [Selenomonadaceae bacterium]